MGIEKVYRASCGYCDSETIRPRYSEALKWLQAHRIGCDVVSETDNTEARRLDVTCPKCGKTRRMRLTNYQRSLIRHEGDVSLAGMCKTCSLKNQHQTAENYPEEER